MNSIIAHLPAPGRPSRLASAGRWLCARIPTPCPLCANRAVGGYLCLGCTNDIRATMRQRLPRCQRCALRLPAEGAQCPDCIALAPAYARTIAAFDYETPADELIRLLKSGLRYSVTRALAALLAEAVANSDVPLLPNTLLIAVPSSLASLRRRGFNPAGEIARVLAPQLGLNWAVNGLRREREGARQTSLDRQGRLRATRGLFHCVLPLQDVPVAIVDDVMTTGGTLDAAARAVLKAGAVAVTALVAARAPTWR
jgi:ComF family protein